MDAKPVTASEVLLAHWMGPNDAMAPARVTSTAG
jgi:hypothetical protein